MFDTSSASSSFAVPDVALANAFFYGETLGIPVIEDGGLLFLKLSEDRQITVYPKVDHAPATYTVLNFEVDGIEAAVDALAERGVVVTHYSGTGDRHRHRHRRKGDLPGRRHRPSLVHRPGRQLSVMQISGANNTTRPLPGASAILDGMTATLRVSGLSGTYGARTLFSGLDLVIRPGDVLGLIGANGSGKTTLLRLLAAAGSQPSPDLQTVSGTSASAAVYESSAGDGQVTTEGSVSLIPSDATIGYLPQEADRLPGETMRDFLARRTGVAEAERQMNTAAAALAVGGGDRYSAALERWLNLGGADFDERAEKVMAELGIGVGLDALTQTLSGGQAARAGLASLLLSRYDLLLLDEPTNDLDLGGLELLERFVAGTRTAVVLVSHDREFLARTVTGIVELDQAQQDITVYDGGYDAFLAERALARLHAREAFEEYAETRFELEQRAHMQRSWADKGVRAVRRNFTDMDKIGRRMAVESSEKQASKVKQTQRRIERLDVVQEPRKEWELRMDIAVAPRSGAVVATLDAAVVRRSGFTLGPVSTQVNWGDRILLTGPNGSGKTTLLAVLLGKLTPDAGRATLGSGIAIGEIDQARGLFRGGEGSLAAAFGANVPAFSDDEVRTLLAKFGLRGASVLRPVASLSPGERTRAALALLQARGVNLLVLDEPTNHLDLAAIEQLEQAMDSFTGTLLLVTHDRRMLALTRSTRHWQLREGQLHE
ncbi:MAG: ATP-binding cassette domain-containing protein [Geodermatophilaceae bacterium]